MATVAMVVAFIIPFMTFAEDEEEEEHGHEHENNVVRAHAVIGITVMCLLSVHVLVALFARPKPGASMRPLWNQLHWWAGRLTIALALINIVLGPAVNLVSFGGDRGGWYAAIFVLLGAVAVSTVVLERWLWQLRGQGGDVGSVLQLGPVSGMGKMALGYERFEG